MKNFDLQIQLLSGVSRTFALTIPRLPPALVPAICNAYLLCRMVDTIEDETSLLFEQKSYFCQQLSDVIDGKVDASLFSKELSPLLSSLTIPAEHALVQQAESVFAVTKQLNSVHRNAVQCCVQTMGPGMLSFQNKNLTAGLKTIDELNQYCYFVAGCVGEMLTKIFCSHSAQLNENFDLLMKQAVSFGQGLQMTNILKDIWTDLDRGVCWLPQDIFTKYKLDLQNLKSERNSPAFKSGMTELIGIAKEHLDKALNYALLIPKKDSEIRHFCMWTISMAILTLRKIQDNTLNANKEVKISRRSVRASLIATSALNRSNTLLNIFFQTLKTGLPTNYEAIESGSSISN